MNKSERETYSERLAEIRVSPTLKARLERVASDSVTRAVTDHIRYALELYVAAEERNKGLPPIDAYMATPSGGGKTRTGMEA